ncbi:MAG: DUF5129 domain-containing protein [Brachybacterium sp.]|uniref:DUF5129 domain-containing protein n=2 Tax=Dermabacteraceae TaxID=85020 RepID=UPI0031ECDABA
MPSAPPLQPTAVAVLAPAAGHWIAQWRTVLMAFSIALVLSLALLMTGGAAIAQAAPPRTVTVTDLSGEVDPDALEAELATVDFRTEVHLVVLVLDVAELGFSPSSDGSLDSAVRAYAGDTAPELLHSNGVGYAEGTVILALDTTNRFVGVYAGQDVELRGGGPADVQQAMRKDARAGKWEQALLAGAETYADRLSRPWWRGAGGMLLAAVLILAGGAGLTHLLRLRRGILEDVDEADNRHAQVLSARTLTDRAARELPEDSAYAYSAHRAHQEYTAGITTLQQLRDQLPDTGQRGALWGLVPAQQKLGREYAQTLTQVDALGDEVRISSDLLTLRGGWREQWENELEPLHDSLAALQDNCFHSRSMPRAEAEAAAALVDRGPRIAQELDDLTARLDAEEITADAALHRLDEITRQLSAEVAELRSRRISRLADDHDEEGVLWDSADALGAVPYRSVRERRHTREAAGRGEQDTFWSISPVRWYVLWHGGSYAALADQRAREADRGGSGSLRSGRGRGVRTGFSRPGRRAGRSSGGRSRSGSSSRF